MAKSFKDRVREQFGRTADGYVRNKGFASGKDLEEAAALLKPTTDDTLLDVATGGGHTALFFAPMVRQVVASDLTMQMLKRAQEYISEEGNVENVIFREADAEDLPFPAGSFTLLTCRIAPHHFPDTPRALSEFHRVLRRGGRMAIIDTLQPDEPEIAAFFQDLEQRRDPTHVRAFTKAEWLSMIEDAEFILHETKVFEKTHDFQEWAQRSGLNRNAIQELNRLMIEAPAEIQDYFQIETFAGEVESFTDRKLLIYASRPAKK
ncbi:MAG: SAM-dependent methyltransferase [Desulfuromonas sp.]|nr:MAG: SAM-dependent methyltransferase [Desulfuromonas sp.]